MEGRLSSSGEETTQTNLSVMNVGYVHTGLLVHFKCQILLIQFFLIVSLHLTGHRSSELCMPQKYFRWQRPSQEKRKEKEEKVSTARPRVCILKLSSLLKDSVLPFELLLCRQYLFMWCGLRNLSLNPNKMLVLLRLLSGCFLMCTLSLQWRRSREWRRGWGPKPWQSEPSYCFSGKLALRQMTNSKWRICNTFLSHQQARMEEEKQKLQEMLPSTSSDSKKPRIKKSAYFSDEEELSD